MKKAAEPTPISIRHARRFLLIRQALYPPRDLHGIQGVEAVFRRLRTIQYDPIDIAGRNPELVLQARVGNFRRPLLTDLLYTDRGILDAWDKQMSIIPVSDYPNFSRFREMARLHPRFAVDGPVGNAMPRALEEIRKRGALSSLDMEGKEKLDWAWAPARVSRAALEALWFRGDLGIRRREGTRRVYDLPERLLPPAIRSALDPFPDENAYLAWRVERRIGAVGLLRAGGGDGWLGIHGLDARRRRVLVGDLCRRGVLKVVRVAGMREPFYYRREDEVEMIRAAAPPSTTARATVLAPLDNLLWDRKMIRDLFDFEYVWEVYKPADQRRWGYYVLPVLYGDRFVGRFEPGRDPDDRTLVIKRWWSEKNVKITRKLQNAVAVAARALARSLGSGEPRLSGEARDEPALKEL